MVEIIVPYDVSMQSVVPKVKHEPFCLHQFLRNRGEIGYLRIYTLRYIRFMQQHLNRSYRSMDDSSASYVIST